MAAALQLVRLCFFDFLRSFKNQINQEMKLNLFLVDSFRKLEFVRKKTTDKFHFKVRLTPKYFFRSNKTLHLFETHCAFLPRFNPKLDFLQAVKVTKSGHYLLHDRASKGYGSIPGWTSQTDLHRIKFL